jgi:hypothetical protein
MESIYTKFWKWVKDRRFGSRSNNVIITIVVGSIIFLAAVMTKNIFLPHILGASTKTEAKLIILPTPTIAIASKKLIDRSNQGIISQQASQGSEEMVDCTGPDGKHLQISQKECNDFNNTWSTDPFISCSISSECGGGTALLKKSACSKSTCCQIGDKWYLYSDKNQCGQDQKTYWDSTHPTPTTTPTLIPTVTPTFTPTPTVNILQRNFNQYGQCVFNTKKLYSLRQKQCMNLYDGSPNGTLCLQIILQQEQQELNNCSNLYPNNN